MKAITMAVLGAAALMAACSSTDEAAVDPDANANANSGIGQDGLPPPGTVEYFNLVVGDRVFFGTDRFDLDDQARSTLAKQAEWMLANPGTSATIEGHADERGTREYNLALGAQRASSAQRFLIAQGVPAGRLSTVSFGKERPVALCSDESCWSQNRRAVSVVIGAPAS